MISCGEIRAAGGIVKNPKEKLPEDTPLEIRSRPFVSRGGEKLQSAYEAWGFPVAGKVFVDAGASSGGFTHFLLLNGAKLVHAVDVGFNQLDFSLRLDSRVRNLERTNILAVKRLEPTPQCGGGGSLLSLSSEGGTACFVADNRRVGYLSSETAI